MIYTFIHGVLCATASRLLQKTPEKLDILTHTQKTPAQIIPACWLKVEGVSVSGRGRKCSSYIVLKNHLGDFPLTHLVTATNLPSSHGANIWAILSVSMAVVMVTYKCHNQLLAGLWFQTAQRSANHLLWSVTPKRWFLIAWLDTLCSWHYSALSLSCVSFCWFQPGPIAVCSACQLC